MVITCDPTCSMGYIYLMPYKKEDEDAEIIEKYVEKEFIQVPLLIDGNISEKLESLKLMDKTYLDALTNDDFSEKYCNDKRDGYFRGIELNLYKADFIDLIKEQAFRVYEFHWIDYDLFHLICLDKLSNVFSDGNVLYPMNDNRDVFVICRISEETCYIKGLVSSREDLYPLEYLKRPEFYLYE